MWTWSDLHCDFVHPVGEDYEDQIWIRNLSRVRSDGAFDSHCVSDVDHLTEYGWIMDPRSVQDNWTEAGHFRRHGWKAEYGCLNNGSCVYVGNMTYEARHFLDGFEIELDVQNVLILILGVFTSLLTILGNLAVIKLLLFGHTLIIQILIPGSVCLLQKQKPPDNR